MDLTRVLNGRSSRDIELTVKPPGKKSGEDGRDQADQLQPDSESAV